MKNKIASFGEIVWDSFGNTETLGGAPLNFAYFCTKFGCDAAIISAVGRDRFGKAALEKISENSIAALISVVAKSINADAVIVHETLPTGIVDVGKGPDGLPEYDIRHPAAWDEIALTPAAKAIVARCEAFCFGTLSQRSPVSAGTLRELLKVLPKNCLKVFDANLRQKYFNREVLNFSLSNADILKLNDAELPIVFETIFAKKSPDFDIAANAILEGYPSLKYLVCTIGAEGHIIYGRGITPLRGLPKPVEVVDTVGAGDAFTAGFVSAILGGAEIEAASERAAESAAFACSRRGAIG